MAGGHVWRLVTLITACGAAQPASADCPPNTHDFGCMVMKAAAESNRADTAGQAQLDAPTQLLPSQFLASRPSPNQPSPNQPTSGQAAPGQPEPGQAVAAQHGGGQDAAPDPGGEHEEAQDTPDRQNPRPGETPSAGSTPRLGLASASVGSYPARHFGAGAPRAPVEFDAGALAAYPRRQFGGGAVGSFGPTQTGPAQARNEIADASRQSDEEQSPDEDAATTKPQKVTASEWIATKPVSAPGPRRAIAAATTAQPLPAPTSPAPSSSTLSAMSWSCRFLYTVYDDMQNSGYPIDSGYLGGVTKICPPNGAAADGAASTRRRIADMGLPGSVNRQLSVFRQQLSALREGYINAAMAPRLGNDQPDAAAPAGGFAPQLSAPEVASDESQPMQELVNAALDRRLGYRTAASAGPPDRSARVPAQRMDDAVSTPLQDFDSARDTTAVLNWREPPDTSPSWVSRMASLGSDTAAASGNAIVKAYEIFSAGDDDPDLDPPGR